jgi:hypothetical protein
MLLTELAETVSCGGLGFFPAEYCFVPELFDGGPAHAVADHFAVLPREVHSAAGFGVFRR